MQPEKQTSSKGSTLGLALLFGVGGVSLSTTFNGFAIGALIGALFAQVFHLRSRTQWLEEQLRQIRQSMQAGAVVEKPIERAPPQPTQVATPAHSVGQTEEVIARERAAQEQAIAEQARRQAAARQAAAERLRAITPAAPQPVVPAEPGIIDQAIASAIAW